MTEMSNSSSGSLGGRFPALSTGLGISCRPLNAEIEPFWTATLRDVSKDGLSLVVPFHCEPGAHLVVTLTVNGTTHNWEVVVKHARRHSCSAAWVLGCTILPPNNSKKVVDPLPAGHQPVPPGD